MAAKNLVLVGAGAMGGALLSGWLNQDVETGTIYILDPALPEPIRALADNHDLVLNPRIEEIGNIGAVVLAVKPQIMDQVCPALVPLVADRPIFISIAAGRTIASLEAHFGGDAAIVRAMPNMAAAVGKSMTVAFANPTVATPQLMLAGILLEAAGKVSWVAQEGLIDAATAVSGSGPAYVFLFAEYLAKAGIAAGLAPDLAALLARETISGAGELLAHSKETPENLRHSVTSPGGTTEAALSVLQASPGFDELMVQAVLTAAQRSRDLAS